MMETEENETMGKRQQFTAAQITRAVSAARHADPACVVEFIPDAGTVRILPETEADAPDNPFDKWKAARDEG
jgi:hypothetical protein